MSDIESSATRIAILHEGRLVAYDTPEAMLLSAAGGIWEAVVPTSTFEGLGQQVKISRAVRKADGVHVRIVASEPPCEGAHQVTPTLEDAYLYIIGSQTGDDSERQGDG